MISYTLTYRDEEHRSKCDDNPGLTVVYLGVGTPVINLLARKFLRQSKAYCFGELLRADEINADAFSSWLLSQSSFSIPSEDPQFIADFGQLSDSLFVYLDDPWIAGVKR